MRLKGELSGDVQRTQPPFWPDWLQLCAGRPEPPHLAAFARHSRDLCLERRPGPSVRRARALMWAAWTVSRILSAAEAACSHFSGPPVAGRLVRATRSGTRGHGRRTEVRQELLALARDGVCRALPVAGKAVRSYRTVSPLPRTPEGAVRRFALCCTFPQARPRARVAVSHHRVQSCPDFPPRLDRAAAAACPRRHPSAAAKTTARRSVVSDRRAWFRLEAARLGRRPSRQAALMAVIFTRRYSWR